MKRTVVKSFWKFFIFVWVRSKEEIFAERHAAQTNSFQRHKKSRNTSGHQDYDGRGSSSSSSSIYKGIQYSYYNSISSANSTGAAPGSTMCSSSSSSSAMADSKLLAIEPSSSSSSKSTSKKSSSDPTTFS